MSTPQARIHFLDNLRTFAIFLVILYHSGIVYESSGIGASFWIVDDPATNNLAGLLNLVMDIFVMPTIFFVSGFFAPLSLAKGTGAGFVRAKLRRLMLPWLVAVLTLVPLYKALFLFSRGLPQEHWTRYFHFSNGIFGQSWLWFLPVLFFFNLLYLGLRVSGLSMSGLSVRAAVITGAILGFAYSLIMDLLGLLGWTKIGLVDFQNERLLIYFMVFLLGAHCFHRRAFDGRPFDHGKVLYNVVSWTLWLPITLYIVFLLYPWMNPGKVILSGMADRWILWASFQLSLCGLLYLSIMVFWKRQNTSGPIRRFLNHHSYGVYIVHTIVLGVIASALLHSELHSLIKYALLTLMTFGLSYLAVVVLDILKRALNIDVAPVAAGIS